MTFLTRPETRGFARFTGLLYLSVAVIGPFSILYVPSQIVGDDAATTMQNLISQRGLFVAGTGGEAAIMLIEVVLAVLLYAMFKQVNPVLSGIAALSRFAEAVVMAAMLLFSAAALYLANAQQAELVGAMLYAHDAGVWVWQMFFALHLVILGQLVAASGQYPRLIGHAMSIGSVGYLLDTMTSFAFPQSAVLAAITPVFLIIVTLAELGFALLLVLRGPRA